MHLTRLKLVNFRNYSNINIEFPEQGALLEGANGSGKTNLLESIYVLCTGKSQRGSQRQEMIHNESEIAFIEGFFNYGDTQSVSTSIGFGKDKKISMQTNGEHIDSFSKWFGRRPVVSFGSDDLEIVTGSPEYRRRFLDLFASQLEQEYLEALIKYRYYLTCRNKILESNLDNIQCSVYEQNMAETGSIIFCKRKEIIEKLSCKFKDLYEEISDKKEDSEIVYFPSIKCDCSSKEEWKNVFYNMLNERRKKDIEMGFSSVGPHRDDIHILINSKPAKSFGSRGQCRSLALSLKMSSAVYIEQCRKERMIYLIDDAVSELDPQRTSRVYPLIENKGQVFIATPSIGEIKIGKDLLRCKVNDGKIN
jgi:DNA replication and repair protein RecF